MRRKLKIYKILAMAASAGCVIYAAVQTRLLYQAWSGSEFYRALMISPLDKESFYPLLGKFFYLFNYKYGYFVYICWERFWLRATLIILVVWLLYALFWILVRRQERVK